MQHKHQAIINNLCKYKDIIILKQDKGRGIAILNGSNYVEKCLSLQDCDQFRKLYHDSTESVKRKVQRRLRKV